MTDIAPPATGVWYDLDETVDAVLHILRLQGGDIDVDRIAALVPAAALAIDAYVDGVTVLDGPPPAPDVQYALERKVIELYTTDMPTAPNGYPAGPTEDLLDSLIAPRRRRWGI